MFTLNYFWFCMIAWLCSSPLVVSGNRANGIVSTILSLAGIINLLAILVFLILGFWWMGSWWMPLVMFVLGWLVAGAGAALFRSYVSIIFCLLAAPTFVILAYLGMFGVL